MKVLLSGSVRKRSIATFIPSKASAMIYGGICRRIVWHDGQGVRDDAESQSSIAMSVSCSAPMTWHTGVSSDTGRAI